MLQAKTEEANIKTKEKINERETGKIKKIKASFKKKAKLTNFKLD